MGGGYERREEMIEICERRGREREKQVKDIGGRGLCVRCDVRDSHLSFCFLLFFFNNYYVNLFNFLLKFK